VEISANFTLNDTEAHKQTQNYTFVSLEVPSRTPRLKLAKGKHTHI